MSKKLVDNISKTFCGAKWLQSTIYLHTGNTHSCCFTPIHKVDPIEVENNPSSLHHTKLKKTDRLLMKAGMKILGCDYCWKVEECGGDVTSERYQKTLDPEWGLPYLEDIRNLSPAADYNPRYLELSFDYKCNLRCMYCSPFLSTSWEKEIKQFGPYPTSSQTGNLENISKLPVVSNPADNPFVKAFWKWWPSLKKDLVFLRLTGGEPLLDTDTWKILESVTKEPVKHLSLGVNSNLSVPDELIEKLIKALNGIHGKCKKAFVFTSCDAFGVKAEYIRYGLQFEKFLQNIERVIEKTKDVDVSVTITFNLLSLTTFETFLETLLLMKLKYPQRLYFSISLLDHPEFLNVDIAPDELKKKYAEIYLHFMNKNIHVLSEKEILDLKQLCARLTIPEKDYKLKTPLHVNKADFAKFISEYDRRKNTDFLSVFPEFGDFYQTSLSEDSDK